MESRTHVHESHEQELEMDPAAKRPNARVKSVTYFALATGLLVSFVLLRSHSWHGGRDLHTVMKVISALLALTVGALALIRYIAKRDNTILFIGAAFLGTALLDGYHALASSRWFAGQLSSSSPHLIPWSWNASRIFLAGLMVMSLLAWHRQDRLGERGAIHPWVVFSLVGGLTLGAVAVFSYLPLPRIYFPPQVLGRPLELVSGLLFGLALVGYLKKGKWREDPFEYWLVLSIIVGLFCQTVLVSNSTAPFAGTFDVFHLLKIVSYHCVLAGLILGLMKVQVRAEMDRDASIAAEKLERITKDLRKRNAELDEFTYVASHDLQEPLRKMSSFVALLEKDIGDDVPERAKQDMFYIGDAATRMQKLVKDLLALSRVGRTAMQRKWIPLDQCVDQALDSLMIQIEELGAKITRDPLPEVYGDQTMITQLYQNLIGNAVKFTREGQTPEVHLTVEKQGSRAVFGVKDNGIGISSDYLTQVFVPFKRLHGRSEYEGSGIGLAICRNTAERHGGSMWCESEPGVGSHFRFTIADREIDRDATAGFDSESAAEVNEEEPVEV